jgi:hypothetical protein
MTRLFLDTPPVRIARLSDGSSETCFRRAAVNGPFPDWCRHQSSDPPRAPAGNRSDSLWLKASALAGVNRWLTGVAASDGVR